MNEKQKLIQKQRRSKQGQRRHKSSAITSGSAAAASTPMAKVPDYRSCYPTGCIIGITFHHPRHSAQRPGDYRRPLARDGQREKGQPAQTRRERQKKHKGAPRNLHRRSLSEPVSSILAPMQVAANSKPKPLA